MKKLIYCAMTLSAITFTACNNNTPQKEKVGHDMNSMNMDTAQPAMATDDKEVKVVTVSFMNVDAKVSAAVKEIVGHYLHIKNALTNDNGPEAANGGKAMEEAIRNMDKSLLTAEQKKLYDDMEDELKEHAEHIGKNGDKINHQRDHFSLMSADVYDLVKAFGAGRPLYHDHCPMFNENKGAIWLSEMKEIKNPYYGAEMLTCGTVEEIIK